MWLERARLGEYGREKERWKKQKKKKKEWSREEEPSGIEEEDARGCVEQWKRGHNEAQGVVLVKLRALHSSDRRNLLWMRKRRTIYLYPPYTQRKKELKGEGRGEGGCRGAVRLCDGLAWKSSRKKRDLSRSARTSEPGVAEKRTKVETSPHQQSSLLSWIRKQKEYRTSHCITVRKYTNASTYSPDVSYCEVGS